MKLKIKLLLIMIMINILLLKNLITQLPHHVPGTSPEGFIKFLISGTYKGPSGNSQGSNTKTDSLMKKLFFRSNSPCITCLFVLFTGRANIQKF